MRVLMIGAYPAEPGVVNGGIESATSSLVPALAARQDIERVTVVRFVRGEAPPGYRREGPKVEVYFLPGQRRWRTVTGSVLDVRKARTLAARLKPDVVHGQEIGWNGDIATKCTETAVVTVHGMPHVEIRLLARDGLRDKLRIKPVDRLVRRVLRRAKVVVSISDYDTRELATLVGGRQVSIANAIGAEFFDAAPPGATPPRFLFAGVMTPRKNPVGLLNGFARLHAGVPQARLAMIGPQPDPAYERTVRSRIAELGLADSVEVVDLVGNERLRREIATSRALVLFSRQETAPTIIAQAMAAGKPVVATRVGGVAEMVDDGATGFLVESEDEVALAERMAVLATDQDRCLAMGRRARELALRRYTAEAVAEQTVAAYRLARQ